MNRDDLMWLAGLLEGEGYFCYRGSGPRRRHAWYVQMSSADKDVIERAAKLLRANVTGPYAHKHYSLMWRVTLARRQEVVSLVRALQPHMSARRSAQIQVLLDKDQSC